MRVTLATLKVEQAEAEQWESEQREWKSLVKLMTPEEFDRAWKNCDEAWAINKRLLEDALFRNFALPLYYRWRAEKWTPRFDRISNRIFPRNKGYHGALSWAMVLRINDHLYKRVQRPPFIAACGAAAAKYKNQQPKSSFSISTEAFVLESEIALLNDSRYVERLRVAHEEAEDRNAERWPREQARHIEQAKKLTEERAKTARRWAKDILAAEREGRDLPAERRDKLRANKRAKLESQRAAQREAGAAALAARNVAIVAARASGDPVQAVADRFGVSKSIVYNVTHAARRDG